MRKFKTLLQYDAVRLPLCSLGAFAGGYLLSVGTVGGIVSPLAAAFAGICSPLYVFCILFGSLLAYILHGTPEGMTYLLTSLVTIACVRIIFYEAKRPHVLAVLTAVSCSIAGALTDLVLAAESGFLPLYIMEALLIGTAAYFLANACTAFRREGKLCLDTGKSFTFAISYLLLMTALCGLDLEFCNVGRVCGITVTLLTARHFRQNGGTLLGALTACASVLCSVKLGTPLLFLPVTAMLAGFLSYLPNALYIPVFFLMQLLSSAVLDSSAGLAKILVELLLSCCIYALCCHVPLYRIVSIPAQNSSGGSCVTQREQFLSASIGSLREEAAAIMHRLRPQKSENTLQKAREELCTGCKNEGYCWKERREKTERAFRQLLHEPGANPGPEALSGCIRRTKLNECFQACSRRAALAQTECVHLSQSRSLMMEYLGLMEELMTDAAKQRELAVCTQETEELQELLRQCRIEFRSCFIHRLKSGRYAAEVYCTAAPPTETVQALLSDLLGVSLCAVAVQKNCELMRYCYYQQAAYTLEYTVKQIHADGYARCGDTADAFTDAEGNCYLVLSDGMGSGSAASLVSKMAVHAFTQLVRSGMPPETAIRFANTVLLSETNTECFATFDVLRLNADTGELRLYKSGASATLLLHKGEVTQIASKSFPIGIVPKAEPFSKTFSADEHDRIIMLSDGVPESEYPYLKTLLLAGLPLVQLSAKLCERAVAAHGGKAQDDVSVIAAAVCSTSTALETGLEQVLDSAVV